MKTVSILLIVLCLVGCAHNIQMNPNIQPNVYMLEKKGMSVGVVFTDKLATYSETVTPSTYVGSAHTYTFEVGPPLQSALLRAVEAVYDEVAMIDNTGLLVDYPVGYKFDLENAQIDVTFQQGFWTVSSRGNVNLSVSLERYGPDGLENRMVLSGSGFMSGGADAFNADSQFAQAVEDAIKQVSENAANVMMSN